MKKKVLFIGSFKKSGKEGNVGGQMSACNLLLNSDLKENYSWVLIDTTANTNNSRSFISRLLPGFRRIFISIYHLLFGRIDVLLAFTSNGFSFIEKGFIIRIANFLNIKTIIAPRSGFLKMDIENKAWFHQYVQNVFLSSTYIICQGENWKNYFNKTFYQLEDKLEIISNWIDTEIPVVPEKNNPTINILFLGWITQNKGVYELIEAIQDFKNYNLRLTLAGDGDAFNEIRDIINKESLGSYVQLLGWVHGEEKKKLLVNSDIFILPSFREGMPNSLIEAMLYESAVISTNVGGIPDLIKNYKSGILINPGDVNELKTAIEFLLMNPDQRKNFSKEASSYIKANHSLEQAVLNFSRLFNS